jgi:hypothetical protein
MGKDDKNSGAYYQYKAYSDRLRKEADDLYRNGLNTESRRRLSDLRRMYSTDIVPIQNAWNKRKEEADFQMKARVQHPELRFTRDAATTSIDEYIDNPEGGYGVVNLNNISAAAGNAFKNFAKLAREGKLQGVDAYTNRFVTPYGIDPNHIRDWINNPSVNPTMTSIMNDVLKSQGINEDFLNTPNGRSILNEAIGTIQSRAWDAMGETKEHYMENFENREMLKAQIAAAKKAAEQQGETLGDLPDIREEAAGVEPKEGYSPDAKQILGSLKGGNNSFKASYFGRQMGIVNPLAVYEDYKKEIERGVNEETARKNTLNKYKSTGVSNIISDEQYNMFKGMGYTSKTNFRGKRYNNIEKDLDNLVIQHTRYSTNMAGYEYPDEIIRGYLTRKDNEGEYKSAGVWKMDGDKKGAPDKDLDDLNLYSSDNTKGNKVVDVLYDPRYKGHIVVSFSNGQDYQRRIITPDAIDARLTKYIAQLESDNKDARAITAGIARWLNMYNKTKGKTAKEE